MSEVTETILVIVAIVVLGGSLGVIELMFKRRRSPRGGIGWLFVLFAMDAIVAVCAFLFLDNALSDDFLPGEVPRAIAALLWSPLLLRTQIETFFPPGRVHNFFKLGPAVRLFLDERVDVGSAAYRTNWIENRLLNAVPGDAVAWLRDTAIGFLRNRTSLSDSVRDELVKKVHNYASDPSAGEAQRAKALCQLLIENGGLSLLKQRVKTSETTASASPARTEKAVVEISNRRIYSGD